METYKIVYHGPGLSGKTTSIQYIQQNTPNHLKTEVKSIATETDRTVFCEIQYKQRIFSLVTAPG